MSIQIIEHCSIHKLKSSQPTPFSLFISVNIDCATTELSSILPRMLFTLAICHLQD